MRTQTISRAALVALLSTVRHAEPIGFIALTEPEQRKGPWGVPVRKLVKVAAMTGCRWQNAVREASEDRAWGEREGSALVTKEDRKTGQPVYYLPAQNPRPGKPLYLVPGRTGRLTMVPAEQVVPFLRVRPEVPVVYRDYRVDHIVALAIGGRRYRVRAE